MPIDISTPALFVTSSQPLHCIRYPTNVRRPITCILGPLCASLPCSSAPPLCCQTVRFIHEFIAKEGYRAVMLHGQRSQPERDIAMREFRSGKCQVRARVVCPLLGHQETLWPSPQS